MSTGARRAVCNHFFVRRQVTKMAIYALLSLVLSILSLCIPHQGTVATGNETDLESNKRAPLTTLASNTVLKGLNPWMNCTAEINCTAGIKCWDVFRNGECNIECNNIDCLYDGFDCEHRLLSCNKHYDIYCLHHYGNGRCDNGCNNEECNWDGLDCERNPPVLASGSLVITVLIEPEVFRNNSIPFLRELGHALKTNVKVKADEEGRPMIYPWKETDMDVGKPRGQMGTEVYLEIDNRRCSRLLNGECFDTAAKAAQFLAAAHSRHALKTAFHLKEVRASPEMGASDGSGQDVKGIK